MSLDINLNIPGYAFKMPSDTLASKSDEGALMFVSLICSSLRALARPSSKLKVLEMLFVFGKSTIFFFLAATAQTLAHPLGTYLSDEHKLERIVPYLCTMLQDRVALVRAEALRTLTQLLSAVKEIPQADADFFKLYLIQFLSKLSEDREPLVRTMYASCVASLAVTSQRFLEKTFALRNDDELDEPSAANEPSSDAVAVVPSVVQPNESFDNVLDQLRELMQGEIVNLVVDREPSVNRAIFADVGTLCTFFGPQRADELLQHLITNLNNPDWQLRCVWLS